MQETVLMCEQDVRLEDVRLVKSGLPLNGFKASGAMFDKYGNKVAGSDFNLKYLKGSSGCYVGKLPIVEAVYGETYWVRIHIGGELFVQKCRMIPVP